MKIDFTKNPSDNRKWGTTFRVTWIFIFIMFLPFSLHSQTTYNIWYVGTTSTGTGDGTSRANQKAWSSFDKSVLEPGDFVYFGEGTYSPNISFAGKNGTPGALITYQADPSNSDSVIISGVTGTESRGFGIIDGSYIRVKGFHVRNVDLGFQVGADVNVVYVDSCSIRTVNGGCLVRGVYDVANPSVADCDSVWLRWNDLKINKQTASQTDVIVLAWVNNVFIIGNKLWQDNKMGSSHNDGIQSLPGMGNVTIANNLIITEQEESSQVGMYNQEWAGYRTILYNNVFIQKGTSAGWSHWNATGPGVQIVPAGQTFVYNNTMYALQNANNFGKSDTTTFRNNIFITTTAAGGGALGTVNTPIPSTYTADYNLYWRGNTTYAINLNEAYGRTFSYWQGLGQEANGKNSDPLFVDLSNDNLSLQPNSPCLNAGVNLQSEVEGWGIEGVHWEGFNNPYVPWSNPVPRGNNPTIGAWEFTNGTGGNYPPNPPADPFPANGAIDQQTSLTLSWSCTDPDGDPLTYDVYFGTDNNPPLVSANLTDASFNPGNLNTNTTYYWKIVAKDNQGHSTSGQIWHFATIFVDTTPPELLSAALQDSVTLKLMFSEPLEQSTAQNINNYSITNGITISSASLSGSEVTLTTSTHSPGSYSVTVSNVTDLAGNIISSSANSAEYEFTTVTELVQLNIIDAEAQQWFQNYIPPNSIDGITYYIDPESRWGGAIPMPDEIIFDLGSIKSIGQTRFSFVWWFSGRIYIYSVYSSLDGNNWSLVADSVTSASDEWSILDFDIVQCRYVKLISLSNNQSQWAGLYEAEIWGLDSVTPVELTSFEGEYNDGKVILKWITSAETNFHGFDVERRTENSVFEKIAFINGNGTTTNSHTYNYSDQNLSESKYYYRLKEISSNGDITYSSEIMVDIPALANFELQQNYPNPFNPTTKISIRLPHKTSITLSVYNMLGELIRELAVGEYESGTHTFDFDASGLSSGIYFYRIESPEFVDTKKMTILK